MSTEVPTADTSADATGAAGALDAALSVTGVNLTVFGGGSFGSALALVLARNGHRVRVLTRQAAVIESVNDRRRLPMFPDQAIPDNLSATDDPRTALDGARFVFHVVPVQMTFEYLQRLKDVIPADVPIVSCSKGIHTETLQYMLDIVPAALERPQPMAFVSGPSFAKELAARVPTALVVASSVPGLGAQVQSLLAAPYLRCYLSDDVIGVEVGGALKNVFAIAAGVADGLGLGANTIAMLVTRGCAEMNLLAVQMGANPLTLAGLSGMGDLVLTCYGSLSRNRTIGQRLGRGETLQSILASMTEVAEGVPTTRAAARLAERFGMDLPIVRTMNALLAGELTATEALHSLMALPQRHELSTRLRALEIRVRDPQQAPPPSG